MGIYQHFRKEEEPFIDQVTSWKEQVERTFVSRLTDFLDPREQQIVSQIIGTNNDELKLDASGGSEYAERKRMLIAPFYEEVTDASFGLTLLEAAFQEKFITLSHRDVMGAFLSLGIKRDKLGDIFIEDGKLQLVVAEEISDYVKMNFISVKNANVRLEEKDLSQFLLKKPNWRTTTNTVSSTRLDVVLKEIYRVSRKEAQEAIEKLRVKVNHKVIEDNKYPLEEGDLLSYKGKGRSKLVSIDGRTRKDNLRITTAILD